MALFRRPNEQGRSPWDRSQERFRQREYEGNPQDVRRARPSERGFGWARRRDIDDAASQQSAPRRGGHYDRTGEDRYAEGLDEFEHEEGYGPRAQNDWELDEGGVQFGSRRRPGGARYGEAMSGRETGGSEYERGNYGRAFAEEDYRRGGYERRGEPYGGHYERPYSGESSWRGGQGSGGAFGRSASRHGEQEYGPFRGRGPRGYQRSDERVREDVCDRLTDDPEIDASEIDIEVRSGIVILTGTVDSRETKRRAEDVAETVTGVREVQNNLRAQGGQWGAHSQERSHLFGGHHQAGQEPAGGHGAAAGTTQPHAGIASGQHGAGTESSATGTSPQPQTAGAAQSSGSGTSPSGTSRR